MHAQMNGHWALLTANGDVLLLLLRLEASGEEVGSTTARTCMSCRSVVLRGEPGGSGKQSEGTRKG